jgi:ABC-type Fe3+-hydroxamate transport system substrate-binding protein
MPPRRIVSLVPSLTELVCWLGHGDALAGRTRFCTEPAETLIDVPIIGGTKNPRIDRVVAARPELVIANKEENRREDVEALRAAGLEVLLTDPNTVDEALSTIAEIGGRLGARARAEELAADVREALAEPLVRALRVFVAVWKEPLMGLGSASYGHDLITQVGAINVLAEPRYPELSLGRLAKLMPDLILLPDEPYPFKEADRPDFEAIAPTRVVDGKLLWWYGPRMPGAIRQLRKIFQEAGEEA